MEHSEDENQAQAVTVTLIPTALTSSLLSQCTAAAQLTDVGCWGSFQALTVPLRVSQDKRGPSTSLFIKG